MSFQVPRRRFHSNACELIISISFRMHFTAMNTSPLFHPSHYGLWSSNSFFLTSSLSYTLVLGWPSVQAEAGRVCACTWRCWRWSWLIARHWLMLSLSFSLYRREMICACVREENMIQKFTDCRVVYCIIILARAYTSFDRHLLWSEQLVCVLYVFVSYVHWPLGTEHN